MRYGFRYIITPILSRRIMSASQDLQSGSIHPEKKTTSLLDSAIDSAIDSCMLKRVWHYATALAKVDSELYWFRYI